MFFQVSSLSLVEGLGNSCVSVSTHNGLDNMDRGLRHFGVLFDGYCKILFYNNISVDFIQSEGCFRFCCTIRNAGRKPSSQDGTIRY